MPRWKPLKQKFLGDSELTYWPEKADQHSFCLDPLEEKTTKSQNREEGSMAKERGDKSTKNLTKLSLPARYGSPICAVTSKFGLPF